MWEIGLESATSVGGQLAVKSSQAPKTALSYHIIKYYAHVYACLPLDASYHWMINKTQI